MCRGCFGDLAGSVARAAHSPATGWHLGFQFVADEHETGLPANCRLENFKELIANRLFLANTGGKVGVVLRDPNNVADLQAESQRAAKCTDFPAYGH